MYYSSNNSNPTSLTDNNNQVDSIDIVALLVLFIRHWKVFLLSVVVFMSTTSFYLFFISQPHYETATKILVKDDDGGQLPDVANAFKDLGIGVMGGPALGIENDIEIIGARSMLKKVADELNLNIVYQERRGLQNFDLYKKTPVIVKIEDSINEINVKFNVSKKANEDVLFVEFKGGDEKQIKWGELIISENVSFRLVPGDFNLSERAFDVGVEIFKTNYNPQVKIERVSKNTQVIKLSIVSACPEKSIDILNTLVNFYNSQASEDKIKVSEETISFIDNRLSVISGELKDAESDVEQYKKEEKLSDVGAQAQSYLASTDQYDKKYSEVSLKFKIVSDTKNYIRNEANKDNTVPSSLGIDDPTFMSVVTEFNKHQLEKSRVIVGMKESNPVYKEYEARTKALRSRLLESVVSLERSLLLTKKELEKQITHFSSQMQGLSTKEVQIRDLMRQQNLKESLFVYLLTKREEAGLAKTAIISNAKVIDEVYVNSNPVKPKKNIILLISLFFGLLLPAIFIYLRRLFDTKLYSIDQVSQFTTLPLLGELPVTSDEKSVLEESEGHTALGEKLRLACANIDFMLPDNGGSKKIMITSSISGEGKSFIASNMAASLSHLGKKVLLVNLDIRKADLAELFGLYVKKGITSYLSDSSISLAEVLYQAGEKYPNLSIVAAGAIPPNPLALISNKRLKQFFEEVSKLDFEYIIVDCPPVGLVADAFVVNKYVDMAIYVFRTDYSHKRSLMGAEELYQEGKLKNMALLFNGVDYNKTYGEYYSKRGYYSREKHYYEESNKRQKKNKK